MEQSIQIRDIRKLKGWYWKEDEYLNGYAKLCGIYATGVYDSLTRHANKDQMSYPSIDLIAKELAISRPSVIKGIKALEEWGIIVIERAKDPKNKQQLPNKYWLTDKSNWKPKPTPENEVGADFSLDQKPSQSDLLGNEKPSQSQNKAESTSEQKPSQRGLLEVNTVLTKHIEGRESAVALANTKDLFETENIPELLRWLGEKGVQADLAQRELQRFMSYWTEPNRTGKQRWQGEKYFDVKRRLVTWFSRVKEFNTPKQGRTRKVI